MTTIDYQQAAVRAGAEAIMRAGGLERFLGTSGLYNLPVWLRAKRDSENALTAATPHLRAGMAEEVRAIDIPEHRLHDQLPSDHWYAGQKAMRDEIVTLLEGGGE